MVVPGLITPLAGLKLLLERVVCLKCRRQTRRWRWIAATALMALTAFVRVSTVPYTAIRSSQGESTSNFGPWLVVDQTQGPVALWQRSKATQKVEEHLALQSLQNQRRSVVVLTTARESGQLLPGRLW
jgi:hypothetical protein